MHGPMMKAGLTDSAPLFPLLSAVVCSAQASCGTVPLERLPGDAASSVRV